MGCGGGCKDAEPGNEKIKTVCRCCQLVNRDVGEKIVSYCKLCDAFICEPCSKDLVKRAIAFGKQFFE